MGGERGLPIENYGKKSGSTLLYLYLTLSPVQQGTKEEEHTSLQVLAIATPEGNLVKTVKASLQKELEKNSSAVYVVPCDSTMIVDVMAILKAIKVDTIMTYRELARHVFNTIVRSV